MALVVTVIASLVLLYDGPDRVEDPERDKIPANQVYSFQFRQNESASPQPAHDMPDMRGRAAAAVVFTDSIRRHDILPVFYPELERIVALEDRPSAQAAFELEQFASDKDPVIRLAAIESMGNIKNQSYLPAISAALDDENPQVRIAALESLAMYPDETARFGIEVLLWDRDREVRLAAIEALADLEIEPIAHSLAGLLNDPDPEIRLHAVNALGEVGGRFSIPYLLQARFDTDANIRTNASAILSELGANRDP